jgi:hypothetical protein
VDRRSGDDLDGGDLCDVAGGVRHVRRVHSEGVGRIGRFRAHAGSLSDRPAVPTSGVTSSGHGVQAKQHLLPPATTPGSPGSEVTEAYVAELRLAAYEASVFLDRTR